MKVGWRAGVREVVLHSLRRSESIIVSIAVRFKPWCRNE